MTFGGDESHLSGDLLAEQAFIRLKARYQSNRVKVPRPLTSPKPRCSPMFKPRDSPSFPDQLITISSRGLVSPTRKAAGSPTQAYAGAKFSEPPSPTLLPKPPQHWFGFDLKTGSAASEFSNFEVHLKHVLKVSA